MSNSSLVSYRLDSPNRSEREGKIKNIIVHHMAGNLSIETCCKMFSKLSRRASSNYCIGSDGRIGQSVDEKYRAWTTGNKIDHESVTIEVANDQCEEPWHVSDIAFARLVDLCADICKRNKIEKLVFTGGKDGNLLMHKWYQATGCPGTYLGSKFPVLAAMVNAILSDKVPVGEKKVLYRVRKTANDAKTQVGAYYNLNSAKKCADNYDGYKVYDGIKCVYTGKVQQAVYEPVIVKVSVFNLRIRSGPGLSYASKAYIAPGKYTIVEKKTADGLEWGKLKSGAGWIALNYTEAV